MKAQRRRAIETIQPIGKEYIIRIVEEGGGVYKTSEYINYQLTL